jgi:hypothetical protein
MKSKSRNFVPIPDRMKKLPQDDRGYPIPVIVMRDKHGRPHFTINDEEKRQQIIQKDQCAICGSKLLRGRWSVGGPLSAFHAHGRYSDSPLHYECMSYALQVCPFLAMPSYTKRIDTKTLQKEAVPSLTVMVDRTIIPERPKVYVAVMHIGQTYTHDYLGVRHIIPNRPYRQVEYWQNGQKIDSDTGERLSQNALDALSEDTTK